MRTIFVSEVVQDLDNPFKPWTCVPSLLLKDTPHNTVWVIEPPLAVGLGDYDEAQLAILAQDARVTTWPLGDRTIKVTRAVVNKLNTALAAYGLNFETRDSVEVVAQRVMDKIGISYSLDHLIGRLDKQQQSGI
jgi:hypothetical protein